MYNCVNFRKQKRYETTSSKLKETKAFLRQTKLPTSRIKKEHRRKYTRITLAKYAALLSTFYDTRVSSHLLKNEN